MTNLKELQRRLNFSVLNSTDSNNLKGGRKTKAGIEDYTAPTTTVKPGGGGAGIPPSLDSTTTGFF